MASSDIVLSAALRNNLLSLQGTQRLIDSVQLRLATGLKINSALDGPQQFFTSQSLNNRAADLGRLLDGINLSIRTIEEADKGVTALSGLLNQAQAIADSARDELSSSTGDARAVGVVDLSNTTDIEALTGIDTGDIFRVVTTNDAGTQIAENIAITTGDTAYTLAAKITDQFADNRSGEITASVTADGYLSIQSADGRTFKMTTITGANNMVLAGFTSLGLDRYMEDEVRGATTLASGTVIAGNTLSSISLYESAGNLLDAGDLIVGSTVLDADGNTVISGLTTATSFTFTVNNTITATTGAITALTSYQDVIDQINQSTTLNPYIRAEFDADSGQIRFVSLQDAVENFQIAVVAPATATTFDIGLGDPGGNLDPIIPAGTAAAGTYEGVFTFNSSTEVLDGLAKDYNNVRDQIDSLVEDANFRGVNLLNGDDLVTFFNEDNSNSLTTDGATFNSTGLGITEASFRGLSGVELSISQLQIALNDVRAFGSSLSNSLAIIQTRRDFTESTISTLKAGAGDLTKADENEEGANLLALQTRQQLGVTALSLAAQSQQSVLRLF
jgi:flagellin